MSVMFIDIGQALYAKQGKLSHVMGTSSFDVTSFSLCVRLTKGGNFKDTNKNTWYVKDGINIKQHDY